MGAADAVKTRYLFSSVRVLGYVETYGEICCFLGANRCPQVFVYIVKQEDPSLTIAARASLARDRNLTLEGDYV